MQNHVLDLLVYPFVAISGTVQKKQEKQYFVVYEKNHSLIFSEFK
jgi:hypothetical protein